MIFQETKWDVRFENQKSSNKNSKTHRKKHKLLKKTLKLKPFCIKKLTRTKRKFSKLIESMEPDFGKSWNFLKRPAEKKALVNNPQRTPQRWVMWLSKKNAGKKAPPREFYTATVYILINKYGAISLFAPKTISSFPILPPKEKRVWFYLFLNKNIFSIINFRQIR